MITIKEAAQKAFSSHKTLWLSQINRNLPYGCLESMVKNAIDNGCHVTQASHGRFLVDNKAWISEHGFVCPVNYAGGI